VLLVNLDARHAVVGLHFDACRTSRARRCSPPIRDEPTSVVEARAALDGRRPARHTNEEAMIDSQMDAVRLNRLGDGPG
jgi:hypothetical protein